MDDNIFGILGVYGKNNLGDEALLEAVKEDVRSIIPDAKFIVFCSDTVEVERIHGDVAVSRRPFDNFFYKLSLIKKMKAFIVGGGTLLYEQGGLLLNIKAIAAFYFWPIMARIYSIRTIAYGQGIGPVYSISMKIAIRLLGLVFDLITLRDRQSCRYMYTGSRCYITSDPVAGSHLYKRDLPEDNRSSPSYLLIAFRFPQAGNRELVKQWVAAISNFAIKESCEIVLFPTQLSERYYEDEILLDEEYRQFIASGVSAEYISKAYWNTIEEGVAYLQNARVVVSNRLHALLLAAMGGVPCIGLGSNDKINGCLQMVGVDELVCFVEQNSIDAKAIEKMLDRTWCSSIYERASIQNRVRSWSRAEPSNLTLLGNFIAK